MSENDTMVLTEVSGAIGTITMNRPDLHNAFNEDMIAALTAAFEEMGKNDAIRAVVLRGNGKSFSAGGDLNWMRKTAAYGFDENVADAMTLGKLLKTINTLPKPTIAVVHGNAFGGGVGLTACCDIAIAEKNTTFCLSEVRIGLIPSIIAPYVIAAIGERQARRFFMTAERFSGKKARKIGLVHESPAAEELEEVLAGILSSLMDGAPGAQRMGKELIREIAKRPIDDDVIAHTAKKIAEARASDDGKEGLTAFLNKGEPSWRKQAS